MKKRILSLALALSLLLALVPATGAADTAEDSLFIGFEDGTTGGFICDGGTLTVTGEEAHSGSKSLLMTGRQATWQGAALPVDKYLTSTLGCYDVSAWVKTDAETSSGFDLSLLYWQNGEYEKKYFIGDDVSRSAGWIKVGWQVAIDTNTTWDKIELFIGGGIVGAKYYIDDISLKPINKSIGKNAIPIDYDFEDGNTHGFFGNDCTIAVTDKQYRSGNKSLSVSRIQGDRYGAAFCVEPQNIDTNGTYEAMAWIKCEEETSHRHTMLVQTYMGKQFISEYLDIREISEANWSTNKWIRLKHRFTYNTENPIDRIEVYVTCESRTGTEYFIDDITFRQVDVEKMVETNALLPSLKDIYENYFTMAAGFDSVKLDALFPLYERHFNMTGAGYEMKSEVFTQSKGVYDFTYIDQVIKRMADAGISVHGHTLVWHNSHAAWLTNNPDGSPLTRVEAIQNLTDYINIVAGHYAGKVVSWDVVLEAMKYVWDENETDAALKDWRNGLFADQSPWYTAFENGADKSKGESGADYIEMAFRLARAADPDAFLFYDDAGYDGIPNKDIVIANMVKEINDKWLAEGNTRLLIEGVNIQLYRDISFDFAKLEGIIKRFADIGVKVRFGETQISVFYEGYESTIPTYEMVEKQAEVYARLFQLCKKYADDIVFVGLATDDYYENNNNIFPALFDENLNPKLAYFAVADPEGYLAGNFDTKEKREAWIKANSLAPNLDTASSWAQTTITTAVQNGIVPETLQNNYQTPCTRAEFCALAVALIEKLTGSPITASKTFDDDNGDLNIRKIGGLEIVTGTGGNNFSPNDPIKRADAAVILEKVARKGLNRTLPEGQASFNDMNLLPYAEKAIRQMRGVSPGIMSGKDGGLFDPTGNFSREECISTLLKLWDWYNN